MGFIADIFTSSKAAKAQTRAADQAAAASQYATDQSIALQREQFNRVWDATAQQRALGNSATGRLQGLLDGTTDPTQWLQSTPGYQFNFDEGQRSLQATRAARGGLLSGAAGREAVRYGQNYGNNIFNQERNALLSQAGFGQTATGMGAQAGANAANASQNALLNNASLLGQSSYARGDAQAGFWGSVGGALNGGNFLASFMKGMKF